MWDTKTRFAAQVGSKYKLFLFNMINNRVIIKEQLCFSFFLSFFRHQHGVVWKLSLDQGFYPKSAQGERKNYIVFQMMKI